MEVLVIARLSMVIESKNDSVSPFAKTDTGSPLESHMISLARQLTQGTQLTETHGFCEPGSADKSYNW